MNYVTIGTQHIKQQRMGFLKNLPTSLKIAHMNILRI